MERVEAEIAETERALALAQLVAERDSWGIPEHVRVTFECVVCYFERVGIADLDGALDLDGTIRAWCGTCGMVSLDYPACTA